MTKRNLILICLLIATTFSFAQNCDCKANYKWVKKTFEENDAGFYYVLQKKGQDAYDLLNENIKEKAINATTLTDCQSIIYEWSAFFRTGHFGFSILKKEESTQVPNVDPKLIKAQPLLKIDYKKFEKQINTAQEPTPEGIWSDGTYKVGILKADEGYQAFIIHSKSTQWKPNQLKFIISPDKKKADLWMRNFSKNPDLRVDFIGNNLINIGNIMYFKRVSKNFDDTPNIKNYIQFLYGGNDPYFQQLSEETVYIRIPSFDLSFKTDIDSIITANADVIEKTNNLIIDVRNNGGGSDASYNKLIPLLYTNPIRTVGIQLRSTTLNNNLMLWLSENKDFDELQRKEFKETYIRLNKHPGEFVNPSPEIISIDSLNNILPYPKNVAILINGGNASATEQFLLAAKQSRKTKLFGTNTMGALDVSNMNDAISPDGNFELSFCTSISYRIPNMAIDGMGIQPDYYLDESIPENDWVNYVQQLMEQ